MTKARPLPRAELVACRSRCTEWLLRQRGVSGEVDPGLFAMDLLIKEDLDPREAEVARIVAWLAIMVLPQSTKPSDEADSASSPALIVMRDKGGWYVVRVYRPA